MKKVLLVLTLLFSCLTADLALVVKQGWQLMGVSSEIDDMSKFSEDNVEEIWHFDASTQKWLGYSPNEKIQAKITDKGLDTLKKLSSWHGFWIKSKREWVLIVKDEVLTNAPSDENSAKDVIELKKGWNLISLPIDSVVSADIFKDMTVWKYNHNQEWEFFTKNEESEDKENFSPLGHIKNSDGIWVKAEKDTSIAVMEEASKLHNFTTKEAMNSYIKEMIEINQRPFCGMEPYFRGGVVGIAVDDAVFSSNNLDRVAVPTSAGNSIGSESADTDVESFVKNATQTNLQESDVDEADIVKHNGVNIFYISRNNYNNQKINVTTFSEIANNRTKPITQITIDKNQNINSMYLVKEKLIVLSSSNTYSYISNGGNIQEDFIKPIFDYAINQVIVDIFDVSNIKDIKKEEHYKIDGNIVTSRVVGDNLYLVSSFRPQVNISYPRVVIELPKVCDKYYDRPTNEFPRIDYELEESSGSNETSTASVVSSPKNISLENKKVASFVYDEYTPCYNINKDYDTNTYYRYDYEAPIVEVANLLPTIESDKLAKQDLIVPSKLYAPAKQQQDATMTTISHITLSDGKYVRSNSFIGYSSTQYASSKALYLVSNQYPLYYDFNNYKTRSSIYKFSFEEALAYKGIGSVYGTPLNQYALSEYKDILRIATTEGFSWGSQGTTNSIYTLKNESELLRVQGVLSGLGKENELIKSVRFMGDKAYLVTFRQTDPFYTIDMSDPEQPKKVGELQVNGYSGYLHPVGEDKILGIGRDADEDGRLKGIKLELFDISDFANPSSLDTIVLENNGYSEIESNPKVLAYRTSDNLFAFPYTSYGYRENSYQNSNYLGVWQVVDKTLKSYKAVKSNNNYGYGDKRGILFDINNITYSTLFVGDEIVTIKVEEEK